MTAFQVNGLAELRQLHGLTPVAFFLWGFINDMVYIPPLPAALPELEQESTPPLSKLHLQCYSECGEKLTTDEMCAV
jgi:hypothetical protein